MYMTRSFNGKLYFNFGTRYSLPRAKLEKYMGKRLDNEIYLIRRPKQNPKSKKPKYVVWYPA